MHPALAALAGSTPKKFHIGSVQLVHMTAAGGAAVIFGFLIGLAVLAILWGIGAIGKN